MKNTPVSLLEDLSKEYFFDLDSYSHAKLFEGNEPIWLVLKKLRDYLHNQPLGQIEGEISPQAYLVDRHLIFIGKGSVVEPGAYIKGPCYIGENCTVRHGAYIRGNLLTGNGCVIGHDTEVKQSIFLDDVHAAHFAYVGDSILGNRVNLGAGTICANFKLDHGAVSVYHNGRKVETGMRKLGVILGDDSQTGCNSVINPGSLIGKQTWSYPNLNFGGFIPAGSVLKNKSEVSITQRALTPKAK